MSGKKEALSRKNYSVDVFKHGIYNPGHGLTWRKIGLRQINEFEYYLMQSRCAKSDLIMVRKCLPWLQSAACKLDLINLVMLMKNVQEALLQSRNASAA